MDANRGEDFDFKDILAMSFQMKYTPAFSLKGLSITILTLTPEP